MRTAYRGVGIVLLICVLAAVSRAQADAVFRAASPATPGPSPSTAASPPAIPAGKIEHVVIIFQENRSTDDLFSGFPGADTVRSGPAAGGRTIALQPIPFEAPGDLDHSHTGFEKDDDNGRMDGFLRAKYIRFEGVTDPPYAHVPDDETKPLWTLAKRYTLADRMFQTNQGPSFPAHLYIIGGTSAPDPKSDLLASENPGDKEQSKPDGGCDSPADMLVKLIDPSGSEDHRLYPCFENPTVMDLLDKKGLSWKYYEPHHGGLWDGPDAIRHLRDQPNDWANVVTPETTIFKDIAAGGLPDVSWVIPNGRNSDHPGSLSDTGPSWVASIVNAIGSSPYWRSTAIFITWDDWGGWYDHVAPPTYNSYELGFRVPLIVVSPYAKRGYVSHRQHEFGSIIRFIEEDSGLGSLGRTDVRSDDLSDCFDFGQAPTSFTPVETKYPMADFVQSSVSFSPPDDE